MTQHDNDGMLGPTPADPTTEKRAMTYERKSSDLDRRIASMSPQSDVLDDLIAAEAEIERLRAQSYELPGCDPLLRCEEVGCAAVAGSCIVHKGDACLWFLPNLRKAWNEHVGDWRPWIVTRKGAV